MGGVITMPQPSARNHRNNPYILDRAFVQVRHSAAGVIWRFRTELAVLMTGTAGVWALAKAVTTVWLALILIMTGTAVTWDNIGQADGRAGCLACGGSQTVLHAVDGSRYQARTCPVCEPARRAG